MCSWRVPEECASFSSNVEYVDYVECFLNLQTLPSAPQKSQHSTVQLWEAHFSKRCFFQLKCWICWMCSWNVPENVLLSGNMLNMLNVFGTYGPLLNEANKFKKHSTYSAFPLKETHFWRQAFEHIQYIQHFRRKHIFGKDASFSCNVECRVPPRKLWGWGGLWVGGVPGCKGWVETQERERERERERETEIDRHAHAHTHTSRGWEAAREKQKDKQRMQETELEGDGVRDSERDWVEKRKRRTGMVTKGPPAD